MGDEYQRGKNSMNYLTDFRRIQLDGTFIRSNEVKGEPSDIVYHKNRTTLLAYDSLNLSPKTVFEIGVKEGGSLVLWDLLWQPDCTSGIDINLSQLSREAIHYMVGKPIKAISMNCADYNSVKSLVNRTYPNGVDLIVDDGPHTLTEMCECFTHLWPSVTIGGSYIIEDWKALHETHRKVLIEIIELNVGESDDIKFFNNLISVKKGNKNG